MVESNSRQDDMQSVKSAKSTVSKAAQKNKQLLKIVNQIFTSNGFEKCNNLNTDWANGVLFVRLFNTLFDETYDLKLSTAESVDAKTSNWNKINAVICFNYLQQQFILIGSTMKALACGV